MRRWLVRQRHRLLFTAALTAFTYYWSWFLDRAVAFASRAIGIVC